MTTWALSSRRVFTPEGERPAAVIVEGERIAAVVEVGAVPEGVPCEDLGELALMPGLVDCHVHVNQPGRTHWEGFATATQAAAAGGVTTLVDMPLNCLPVTTTAEAFATKLADIAADPPLWIDVGFWGGVVPGNADELGALARRGVLGCKAFLCDSGIPEFPASDEVTLRAAMRALAAAGIPLLAHAEIEAPLAPGQADGDHHSYACWLHSRPPAWEEAAIELLIRLCRETGCPVHIVHLSAASALPLLRAARAEGLPISVETCPHYLCLGAEDIPDAATVYKCAPPIREADNREGLWAGLAEGIIDLVVTDHSPCTPELKGDGDFIEAWGGIASLSLGLASVWTQARSRGIALGRLVEWMAAAPARMTGLSQKGALRPGADADLVVFDPDAQFVVGPEHLHFRHKVSPWLGRTLTGRVQRTWLRGQPVYNAVGSFSGLFSGPLGRPLLGRT
ncbi:MAG: allantoinase AllB [Myxococcales bacterium]|nr:allantoinase AllB [Myxococcales bacterium]